MTDKEVVLSIYPEAKYAYGVIVFSRLMNLRYLLNDCKNYNPITEELAWKYTREKLMNDIERKLYS